MTEEETDAVIDQMIWYFDNCDENTVIDRLYPDISLQEYGSRLTWADYKTIADEVRRCRTEALRLFSRYCCQLWY